MNEIVLNMFACSRINIISLASGTITYMASHGNLLRYTGNALPGYGNFCGTLAMRCQAMGTFCVTKCVAGLCGHVARIRGQSTVHNAWQDFVNMLQDFVGVPLYIMRGNTL